MKELFALVAAILAVLGYAPYLRDTFRGKIEPHAYTWLVWSIVSGITLAGQLAKGAGVGAVPTVLSAVFSLVIFFYSLRYGTRHISRTDTLFLVAALLGLVPWLLTKDPTISVVIAVGIDLVAFIPTIRKTWLEPQTERPQLYILNTIRHILSLSALEAYNVATALHSAVMIIANALMSLLTLIARR